jgi:hypothetical protein
LVLCSIFILTSFHRQARLHRWVTGPRSVQFRSIASHIELDLRQTPSLVGVAWRVVLPFPFGFDDMLPSFVFET